LKIGARLPTHGALPERLGIASMAARLEAAGFESLWVSDHLVTPPSVSSANPYSADGKATWAQGTPFFDCVVALAMAAGATQSIELGTAALVLPLRPAVVLAKQIATLDVVSRGRVSLGVGAGWMREEFDALGVDFDRRGRIEENSIGVLRQCWSGHLAVPDVSGLPDGVDCYPVPAHRIPILVGGMSDAALRRVARVADGWLAQLSPDDIDADRIASSIAAIYETAGSNGHSLPTPFRVVVRIGPDSHEPGPIARQIKKLEAAGVTDVIVDADWSNADGPRRVRAALEVRPTARSASVSVRSARGHTEG
jgi:probable F420-dependent oxidoreductase